MCKWVMKGGISALLLQIFYGVVMWSLFIDEEAEKTGVNFILERQEHKKHMKINYAKGLKKRIKK